MKISFLKTLQRKRIQETFSKLFFFFVQIWSGDNMKEEWNG